MTIRAYREIFFFSNCHNSTEPKAAYIHEYGHSRYHSHNQDIFSSFPINLIRIFVEIYNGSVDE